MTFSSETFRIKTSDGKRVPTEFFHATEGKNSETAVVFVPGFASNPLAAELGPVGTTALNDGFDFVRFVYPDLLLHPQSLTYDHTVKEAASVVLALPHTHIVLAAASFGAGALPFILREVNAQQPDKVVGVFGFVAAPPSAVLNILEHQEGFSSFSPDTVLPIRVPTLPEPFPLTWVQYQSVKAHGEEMATNPETLGNAARIRKGIVHYLSGAHDRIAPPQFARDYPLLMARSPQFASFAEVDTDSHHLPPGDIARGLRHVLAQA